MPKIVDLVNKRFNRLVVLNKSIMRGNRNQVMWDCICDCGNSHIVRADHLIKNMVGSCGCLSKENRFKHGLSMEGERIKGYNTWDTMKQRCYNPKNDNYPDYGARGIYICDRWLGSFKNFIDDMGERPTDKHSIDRINVNGNYEPSNCKWGTNEDQSRHKRNNVWIEFNGLKMIQKDWANHLGIHYNTLRYRMKKHSFETIYKKSFQNGNI